MHLESIDHTTANLFWSRIITFSYLSGKTCVKEIAHFFSCFRMTFILELWCRISLLMSCETRVFWEQYAKREEVKFKGQN